MGETNRRIESAGTGESGTGESGTDRAGGRWREHLPAVLMLGSPAAAAGVTLSAAYAGIFLLPDSAPVTVGVALMLRLNALFGAVGAAAGGLRVGGTVPTRIAVVLASVALAGAVYLGALLLASEFIPGFGEAMEKRYGP